MTVRRNIWFVFLIIIVITLLAGFVDVPKAPDIHIGKWEKELKVHLGLDLQGGAQLTYEADLSKIPGGDQASAIEGTRDVIERRVNAFGVSEPLVQTSVTAGKQRVIIELPGVTDVDEAIASIGETPLLDFREQAAVEPLTLEEKQQIQDSETSAKTESEAVGKRLQGGEDFIALADELTQDPSNTNEDGTKKGGDLGFTDPENYVPEFRDALKALADGATTAEPIKTAYGYHIIKREETRQGDGGIQEIRARHILFMTLSAQVLRPQSDSFQQTGLSGQHLKNATVVFDQKTGQPQVNLIFNDEGKKLFGEITKRNVGKPVAIYLDEQPISMPTVQQEITAGEAVITGEFTIVEAKQLASRLTAGALPVPITLVSQQRIGPLLGQVSIEKSFIAGLVGIILVAIFMVAYYRFPGLLAVAALAFYSLVVLAIFKLWPVTLTLAGIAGFILSIGMAVDANILIFERFKEELRSGKPFDLAIEQGFSRAWLSIRDSNVSSIITCLILAWFGTSLIKGFAITLALGIFVSMFSAIIVTRTLMRLFARKWLVRHPTLLGMKIEEKT